MNKARPVRGTHDLLGEDARRHRHVSERALAIATRYGYGEISTPIFEFTEIFQRSLGDTSDVVTKEMYTFTDRAGDSLTLRPENTAAVARAVISGGLLQSPPLKYFYTGPMFRYERPQKGRLRQFHQIGIELIGSAEPQADVEVIALGHHVLSDLGIDESITLEINSLGDPASRQAYRTELTAFLNDFRSELSEDSQRRLERNPMRILDSKNEGDRAIVANAPLITDSFNQLSQDFFAAVQEGLDDLGIAFKLNPKLVRGLDYYTHTAYEFTTTALGAQSAVLAGGRYDGLIEQIGGAPTPGVGWAAGIERMALLLEHTPALPAPLAIVPIGHAAEREARRIADRLRRAGIGVELAFKGKPGQRMKKADQAGARLALSIGDDELASGHGKLRDLATGNTSEIGLQDLDGLIARMSS